VPLFRYFAVIGSLLLAMLFIAARYLPMIPTESIIREPGEVDKSVIRIQSAHKWPERIVFDTSLPTVPAVVPVAAAAPIEKPPREAFAKLTETLPNISENSVPVRTKRKVARRAWNRSGYRFNSHAPSTAQ
jgi:hypothetical protein